MGVPGARAPEGAARRTLDAAAIAAMPVEDARGRVPGEARAAPVPGLDGEAHPRARRSSSSSTTTAGPRTCGPTPRPATSCWRRVQALPGFGDDKARIFVGLLGKRLGVRPPGWEDAAADWPSIADVDSFDRVLEIREQKRAVKAAKKGRRKKPAGE